MEQKTEERIEGKPRVKEKDDRKKIERARKKMVTTAMKKNTRKGREEGG